MLVCTGVKSFDFIVEQVGGRMKGVTVEWRRGFSAWINLGV